MTILSRAAKIAVAATASALVLSGFAHADEAQGDVNLGMMHWIRDTVCTSAQEIVFVPISHDVRVKDDSYAMIDLSEPDPDTAHIVNATERHWLRTNGCDGAENNQLRMAESNSDKSGALDL